ncbi:hypothetical protein [Gordonia sp. NPDC127522]
MTRLHIGGDGSESGMDSAVAAALRADGHTVIGVDQRDAEVIAI